MLFRSARLLENEDETNKMEEEEEEVEEEQKNRPGKKKKGKRGKKRKGQKGGARKSKKMDSQKLKFQVLITTPECCMAKDASFLSKIKWEVCVIDEAHRLKNYDSSFSKAMRENFVYLFYLFETHIKINLKI